MNLDTNFMQWWYEGYDPDPSKEKFGRVLANDERASIIYEPNACPSNPDNEAIAKFIAAAPQLARLLKRYVEEDETIAGGDWEEINAPWLETKRAAIEVLKSIGVEVDCPNIVAIIPAWITK
jgi:hypothetical protein